MENDNKNLSIASKLTEAEKWFADKLRSEEKREDDNPYIRTTIHCAECGEKKSEGWYIALISKSFQCELWGVIQINRVRPDALPICSRKCLKSALEKWSGKEEVG